MFDEFHTISSAEINSKFKCNQMLYLIIGGSYDQSNIIRKLGNVMFCSFSKLRVLLVYLGLSKLYHRKKAKKRLM